MSEVDPSIPIFSSQDYFGLLVASQLNVDDLRGGLDVQMLKRKRTQELYEVCESLSQFTSRNLTIQQVTIQKLTQILDAIVLQYGGVAFCGTMDIPQNIQIGAAERQRDEIDMQFLHFVHSTSTNPLAEEMKKQGLGSPKLGKCALFSQILISKKVKFLKPEVTFIPTGHFDIQNVLVVPVVVNKTSVAIFGLANGKYNEMDAEVLFETAPNIWNNILLLNIEKANKINEGTNRLRSIEKRLEQGKKMTVALSNIWKQDDDELSSMSRSKMLKIKLLDMANYLESTYGGMCFVGPTAASINSNFFMMKEDSESGSSSGSEIESGLIDDEFRFMSYVFSDTAQKIMESVMEGLNPPVMKKAATLLKVAQDKKYLLIEDTSGLKFPPKHFPMNNCLLVPIVVNNSTCGIVGLANGKFTDIDGQVLQDVLSTSWLALLQESFARLDLKFKEKLLSQTLPDFMVSKIKQNSSTNIASLYEKVSIVFSDFVGFTTFSKGLHPTFLVEFLNHLFTKFDGLAKLHGIEKIKTIGDGYMCAGGITDNEVDHAWACCNFAMGMIRVIDDFNNDPGHSDEIKQRLPIGIRVGVGTGGPIIAGIIGKTKLQYDLWGDVVNLSSRMESSGVPGKVQVSEETYLSVKDQFDFSERGKINVKGIGEVKTYLINGKRKY